MAGAEGRVVADVRREPAAETEGPRERTAWGRVLRQVQGRGPGRAVRGIPWSCWLLRGAAGFVRRSGELRAPRQDEVTFFRDFCFLTGMRWNRRSAGSGQGGRAGEAF